MTAGLSCREKQSGPAIAGPDCIQKPMGTAPKLQPPFIVVYSFRYSLCTLVVHRLRMESDEGGLTVLDVELGAGALVLVTVGGIATLHGIVAMVDVGLGADTLILIAVGGIAAIHGIVAMVDVGLGTDTLVLVAVGGIAAIHGIVAMVDVDLGAYTFVTVTIFGVLAVDAIVRKCTASNTETQCRDQYQNLLVHHKSTLLFAHYC